MTNQIETAAAVQHTPGPWQVVPRGLKSDRPRTQIMSDRGWTADARGDDAEAEANARLIASAPALLEALEALEWSAEVDVAAGGYTAGCPSCGGQRDDLNDGYGSGHEDYCTLARALRAARGEA